MTENQFDRPFFEDKNHLKQFKKKNKLVRRTNIT